jgi:acyl-CoA thioesterase
MKFSKRVGQFAGMSLAEMLDGSLKSSSPDSSSSPGATGGATFGGVVVAGRLDAAASTAGDRGVESLAGAAGAGVGLRAASA